MSTWTILQGRVEEQVVDGKRLGRNLYHDSRSLQYPWQRTGAASLSTKLWTRRIPILDQGDTSACTGNGEVGALGTDPLYATVPASTKLDEALALNLYSAAEILDGGAGLPTEDNGSSGLSVCQAAKNAGLISGFLHCLSLDDVLDALQVTPLILGTNWYDSMDSPDSSGMVTISPDAVVRGGHEYECRGIDVSAKAVLCDNSWGLSYGNQGSFEMAWTTLERLLAEQGDGTVSVAATQPAPVPVPVPARPEPTPPGQVWARTKPGGW